MRSISPRMRDHAKAFNAARDRGLSQADANAHAADIARQKDADRRADDAADEARRLRDRAHGEMIRVGLPAHNAFGLSMARLIDTSDVDGRLHVEVYRGAFHGWHRLGSAVGVELDDFVLAGADRSDDPECFDTIAESEYVLPHLRRGAVAK